MMRQDILAKIAEQMGIDLSKLAEAQVRSEALSQFVNAVERLASVWRLGEGIDEFADDDAVVGNIYVEIRRNRIIVEIDTEHYELARNRQVTSLQNGSGNWGDLVQIAAEYGIVVSDSMRERIAYYVGRVIRAILKKDPNAKYDERLRQIAMRWLTESKAAASQGFRSLEDFGF